MYVHLYVTLEQIRNLMVYPKVIGASTINCLTCMFLCGSVEEHCASSAKGCGFDSQGTQILIKKMYNLKCNCKSLWIKASAKCINVNVGGVVVVDEIKH